MHQHEAERSARARRLLLAWCLVAGLINAGGTGTFASFSAATTNAGSSIRTGTLVLSNQVETATACLSTGGATTDSNQQDCDALFDLVQQDGGGAHVDVTLVNDGSNDGASLLLSWAGGQPCTTIDEPSEAFHGTGDLCEVLQLQVQEYSDASAREENDRTDGTCWYGQGLPATPTNDCSYANNRDLAHFSTHHPQGGGAVDLGSLPSGNTRFLRLYLRAPAGQLTNAMQGRRVDFGMTWQLVE